MWVNSELGAGSCFTIYFPKTSKVAVDTHLKSKVRITGTGTILLVEDEETLRASITEFLRDQGYTLLAADSGESALVISSQHKGHIDAMVTDVVMPGMSGRQVGEKILEQRPGLKIIFMSGYTDDAVVRHGIKEGAVSFLQKPFSLTALAEKLHESLTTKN